VEGTRNVPLVLAWKGDTLNFPSVFTTRWCAADGRVAQVLVNYLPEEQTITVRLPVSLLARELHDPAATPEAFAPVGERLAVRLPPLSATLLDIKP
jgi:hypothetical protein